MSRALLQSWARTLGGEVVGPNVLCPGPGHTSKDRSLSVRVSVASPDGFIVHSFAGDDWKTCHEHVRGHLGKPAFSPPRSPLTAVPISGAAALGMVAQQAPDATQEANWNTERASTIWREGLNTRGTLIEAYLHSRGIDLPDEAANEAVRYHGRCRFGTELHPAMVCLVRNIITNEPQGVHRTALNPDRTAVRRDGKTLRMSLGQIASGAVKLDPDEHMEQGLCIGEGIESTLAGLQMGYRPAWSLINSGGIAKFPVLPGLGGLHIFGERDETGTNLEAADECAARWKAAGIDVFIRWPRFGKDLNDELKGAS